MARKLAKKLVRLIALALGEPVAIIERLSYDDRRKVLLTRAPVAAASLCDQCAV
jgi:hypothetical protein